jgi:hypothetical protein
MSDSNKENITPSKSQFDSSSSNTEVENPLKAFTQEELREQFSQLFTRFEREISEGQAEKERLRNENMQIDYEISKDLGDINIIKDLLYKKELRLKNFQSKVKQSNKGLEKDLLSQIYKVEKEDDLNFSVSFGDFVHKFKRNSIEENYSLILIKSSNQDIQTQIESEENLDDFILFTHGYIC